MPDDTPVSIADLIKRHQDATGHSLREIATATGMSKSAIAELAQGKQQRMPQAATIEKLARGIRLPVAVVHHAALVSAGMAAPGPGPSQKLALIVADLEKLNADDLATVEAVVSSLVKRRG